MRDVTRVGRREREREREGERESEREREGEREKLPVQGGTATLHYSWAQYQPNMRICDTR